MMDNVTGYINSSIDADEGGFGFLKLRLFAKKLKIEKIGLNLMVQ